MDPKAFLIVDHQPISLAEAIQYLQASGKLDGFVSDILRQHIIKQELANRVELAIAPGSIERIITDFRLQNELNTPDAFQEWLESQGMEDETFRQQVRTNVLLTQLKATVTQPKLQEYFIERKLFLDQLVLSRIAVESQELAEELRHQIEEGERFEALAQEYSCTDDRLFNGMMGLISRGSLPDYLRAAIDLVEPTELVGPIEVEPFWCIFRVEHVLPASLDNTQLQETLREELFDRWLIEQLQQRTIELRLDD